MRCTHTRWLACHACQPAGCVLYCICIDGGLMGEDLKRWISVSRRLLMEEKESRFLMLLRVLEINSRANFNIPVVSLISTLILSPLEEDGQSLQCVLRIMFFVSCCCYCYHSILIPPSFKLLMPSPLNTATAQNTISFTTIWEKALEDMRKGEYTYNA